MSSPRCTSAQRRVNRAGQSFIVIRLARVWFGSQERALQAQQVLLQEQRGCAGSTPRAARSAGAQAVRQVGATRGRDR